MNIIITIVATSVITILIMNDWISGIYKRKFAEWKKYKLIPFDDYAKKQKIEVEFTKYLHKLKRECKKNDLDIVCAISNYYDQLTSDDN